MKTARYCLLVLALQCVAQTAHAGKPPRDQRYVIHVMTMGQGDELFARFGHIALVVEDRVTRAKEVYNFGTFDFTDPSLRMKYVRGFLNYWLSVWSLEMTLDYYRESNRTTVLRTLNLTPAQAAEVARRLAINAEPEHRSYAYRHYLDNCCTRIRDLLDDVTGKALSRGRDRSPTGRSFRTWTRKALRGLPISGTAILFALGPAIDKPITRYDEQFLPEVVAEDLDATRIGPDRRPLVLRKRTIIERRGPAVGLEIPRPELVGTIAFYALFFAGLVLPILLRGRRISARLTGLGLLVLGLVGGTGGIGLLLFWCCTTHYDTHWNENLLVTPFLHLWMMGPGVKLLLSGRIADRTRLWLRRYLFAALGLIALDILLKTGPFYQDNWEFIAFAALCDLLAVAALRRFETAPRAS